MWSAWLDLDVLVAAACVSVAGAVVGLCGLLLRDGPRNRSAPALLAAFLGLASACLGLAGHATGVWLGPLLLGGVCAALAALRTPWPGHAASLILVWAGSARIQGAALLGVSVAALLGLAWVGETAQQDFGSPPDLESARQPMPLREATGAAARTDRGRVVTVYVPAYPVSDADLNAGDAAIFSAGSFGGRAIRTAPPSADCDCHGWTFTGGRFWIQGKEVPKILEDNGYVRVTDVQPDDLAIYYGLDEKSIVHSGIVVTAGGGRAVLVESKWGKLGRYIAPPDDTPCGGACSYYRSPRDGHLLHGVGDSRRAADAGAAPRAVSAH